MYIVYEVYNYLLKKNLKLNLEYKVQIPFLGRAEILSSGAEFSAP